MLFHQWNTDVKGCLSLHSHPLFQLEFKIIQILGEKSETNQKRLFLKKESFTNFEAEHINQESWLNDWKVQS